MADPPDRGALVQNKGGGFRGGPKRWTGKGPKPARHIPWPEIFKHHISVIEGHQKMVDMVRKHTVEGTGNHRQICDMLDRCKRMLYESKTLSRTFIPPANHRDLVPLGSSSASMYPGYSPADHVYGTAAMEYGSAAAKARAQGIAWKPEVDIEYRVGQGRGIKRLKLVEMRAKNSQDGSGSGSGSGTDDSSAKPNGKIHPSRPEPKAVDQPTESSQPSFYIDTNPTPVDLPFSAKKEPECTTLEPEPIEGKKPKKVKKEHEGKLPDAPPKGQVETEDITAEVDARLRQKEEKRRKKEEKKRKQEAEIAVTEEAASGSADDKKRKRDSEGSSGFIAPASADIEAVEKPKNKKSKKEKKAEPGIEAVEEVKDEELAVKDPKSRLSEDGKDAGDAEDKKKKLRKKKKAEPGIEDVEAVKNEEPAVKESKKRSGEDDKDAGDAEDKKKKKKRKLRDGSAEA